MPRGNGTGPNGMGNMTGRGAGYCAGNAASGFMNPATEQMYGNGGRGRRNFFHTTGLPGRRRFADAGAAYAAPYAPVYGNTAPQQQMDPEMEKQALKNQAESLQANIDSINTRLKEIETNTTEA